MTSTCFDRLKTIGLILSILLLLSLAILKGFIMITMENLRK